MALVVLPIGLHELGLGEPPSYVAIGTAPAIGADNFDQETKDLASLSKGADPIDAQVQYALSVLRQSGAAVMGHGQRFQDIRKITTNVAVLLEQEARTTLARLVGNGDITLDRVAVSVNTESTDNWAEVVIDYVNRRLPVPKLQQAKVKIRPEATS